MKLRDMSDQDFDDLEATHGMVTPFEIAQLHIQRSIAVSLECIATMLTYDVDLGEHAEAGMLQQLKDHSVQDTSND